ncbi:phd finger protein 3 [Limosa lapponica baueri]|uniref:Phd finger protein 3 n=1 Tax=Limosa lapponica baueri TaxID=1758121 RepID=A0A2I0TAF5_LIMLA|nr:phd finger protein 3 [Limosa lapponica baueri]
MKQEEDGSKTRLCQRQHFEATLIGLFLMMDHLIMKDFSWAERHTGVFMDIVDTFNHLIPTEHLDDALFLGSNLENEVCEDFSTSQNVLEDSLKNMLSDKDPMLGSASAQFCLPVLDSNDPNFQMPCSTEVKIYLPQLNLKLQMVLCITHAKTMEQFKKRNKMLMKIRPAKDRFVMLAAP